MKSRLDGVMNLHEPNFDGKLIWVIFAEHSRRLIHPGSREKLEKEIRDYMSTGLFYREALKDRIIVKHI